MRVVGEAGAHVPLKTERTLFDSETTHHFKERKIIRCLQLLSRCVEIKLIKVYAYF